MKPLGKLIAVIFIFLGFYQTLCAQVGINQDNPSDSAVLHISSDSKGVLFPAPDSSDIREKKKNGLFYYSYKDKRFYFFNGNNWQCINPFNATGSSNITAPGELTINDDLAVDNNLTVYNDLTIKNNLSVNDILEATNDNDKIELKKDINAENHSLEVNDATVDNNVKVESGNVNVINGEVTGRGTVPVGTIVMWGKGKSEIPSNWQICDGTKVGNIQTPDLSDRFIVAGSNSTSAGKIAHRKSIYTPDPEECELQQYIYTFTVSWGDEDGHEYNKDVTYLRNSKPTVQSVITDHCLSHYEPCYALYKEKETNPNYYIGNSDCRVNEFKELKKHKLIFIMRVE